MNHKKRLFFKPIDLGVKFELILKIFIVALFSSLLMGSVVYKYFELSLIRREKIHLHLVQGSIIHRLQNSERLDKEDFLSLYGLNSVWILDRNFHVINGEGQTNEFQKGRKLKQGIWIEKRGCLLPIYERIYAISHLRKAKDCPECYFVYISRDLKELNEELFNIRKVILIIVLSTTVLIIFLLNFLLRTTITKPINNIINDIREIETEKKGLLEGNYLREFNYLINNFNNLIKLTNIQKKELENKLKEVQRLNILLSKYHEEMTRFEKLVSIGELSAGVAHEIGNPLNNIIGYLSLSEGIIEDINNSELLDYFSRISLEAKRIDGIVRGMLEFARKGENLEIVPVNLTGLIEKTIDLSQLMIRKKEIIVRKSFPDETIRVKVDVNRFQQVLLNLISNAIDSIESAGTIEIMVEKRSALAPLEKELMDADTNLKNKYFTRVIIKDNGAGIDKKDLKHVFDPFFTTKEPGKGTGLGLSVSLQLIKEMRGVLRLESEKGKGTKAIIILPIHL